MFRIISLSLAIGKEGQNARLAARLTGFKIDIKSETQARESGDFYDYDDDEARKHPQKTVKKRLTEDAQEENLTEDAETEED